MRGARMWREGLPWGKKDSLRDGKVSELQDGLDKVVGEKEGRKKRKKGRKEERGRATRWPLCARAHIAIAEKREARGVTTLNTFGVQTFYHWGNKLWGGTRVLVESNSSSTNYLPTKKKKNLDIESASLWRRVFPRMEPVALLVLCGWLTHTRWHGCVSSSMPCAAGWSWILLAHPHSRRLALGDQSLGRKPGPERTTWKYFLWKR